MNPFHITYNTTHTEDYAIKKQWIDMDSSDFENFYKFDHIIDFNNHCYIMEIEGRIIYVKRN